MASVRKVDMLDVFSESWSILKDNIVPLFICGVITIMPGIVIMLASSVVGGIRDLLGPVFDNGEFSPGKAKISLSLLAIMIILRLIGTLLSAWLGAGLIRFLLKLARREKPSYFELFIFDIGLLVKLFFLWIITMAAVFFYFLVSVGLPAAGIWMMTMPPHPAMDQVLRFLVCFSAILVAAVLIFIIFKLLFAQILYLTIDRRLWAPSAYIHSFRMIIGNFISLFLVMLVGGIICTVLNLCTCFLGLFITAPWFALLSTIFYLKLADIYYNPAPDSTVTE